MSVKIYNSTYKNLDSISMENDRMLIKIIPESGGKLQSIYDKRIRKEYLYQSSWTEYRKSEYDSSFLTGEISGFDEMFPTIVSCYYPDFPWAGTKMPDHGEVWPLPWEAELSEEEISLSVYGVRLPYRLEKKIKFSQPDKLRIDYRISNLSDFPMKFIWAAHPLLNIDEYSTIILPDQVNKVINVMHGAKRLGDYGILHNWPVTRTADGKEYDMGKLNPSHRDNDKYYVYGCLSKGECALYNEKTRDYIKFIFPVDKVPYLGVWVNENGPLLNQQNVAVEPCTGALDNINTADLHGKLSLVEGKKDYCWFLEIELGEANCGCEVISS